LHDPAFGLCVDCGNAIPFDRLQAKPQALRCVACAALAGE
jgi:RNA polymerase-binding transcription factor DksA